MIYILNISQTWREMFKLSHTFETVHTNMFKGKYFGVGNSGDVCCSNYGSASCPVA